VPGLRSDHDAGTSRRDDIAELLEHQGGAVQVDRKDCFRRRLAGGNAGRVDDAGDVASAVAVWTSACTDSRAETSTVTVLTSNPALLRTSAAASALQGITVPEFSGSSHGAGIDTTEAWRRSDSSLARRGRNLEIRRRLLVWGSKLANRHCGYCVCRGRQPVASVKRS
jgi:hypothetical protein